MPLTLLRLAKCVLLTINCIKMSKRCKLQKEYYQQYGSYKGKGSYRDEYVNWLENEVLALRQPLVSGRSEQLHLCPVCNENAGKSYLLSKLPTICQNCDHAWNRA